MTNPENTLMSDAIDEKLYGLVEVAEQQQATAHLILEQIAEERAALTRERGDWTGMLETMRGDIDATISDTLAANLAQVVSSASQTIDGLGHPVAEQMARAAASAEQADQAFRKMIGWASMRLLLWGLGALAGLVLLGWLASGIVLWWDTKAIAEAHLTKQQLQMEVAELRANHNAWVEAGMATKLQRCGLKKRVCVAVDETAGAFGEQSDYRLIKSF